MAEARVGTSFNRDVLVGVAGAALLVAAMAGVFFYERAQFETYDVTWEQIEAGSETETGTLEEQASGSYTFTADADRLSSVVLTLSWTDETGDPDTFEVAVQGPNGTYSDTAEGDASPLEVEIPVQGEPGITTATGRSIADARDQLNTSAAWTNGTGGWSVTVTLTDAPGGQLPIEEDGSQDYELSFAYERWEPTLQIGS